ncbi:SpoIID/LytB domain-containing protein [Paenisporosarcina quisquiliarum]|uniref:SpoIID/LytB domain-containing protein n=1 Tax=Paenisporosarcina quisquiliarum TaxID=365346 RepID=A0A9X3LH85_9BACL|nr:SpoIID/LytB domain-containing protein [Paenisporosarcina quisquiliarum]MCZ8537355.1 SpoIID/LytB domain-containing protein [Paenisporosarcina quisquiliarum]
MLKNVFKYFVVFTIVSALFFQGVGQNKVAAEDVAEPVIRIGMVPDVQSLKIGGKGTFDLVDKVTGEVLFSGTDEEFLVELASTAEIKTNYRLQVSFTTSEGYVADWLSRAEAAGYSTYVEDYNNGYRLHIGEFPADASFTVRTNFKNDVIAKGLAASDAFWKVVTIVEGETTMKATKNGEVKSTSNPVQVLAPSERVTINGKTYRGIAEVGFNSKGTLAGINELLIEEYLYGVVPRELPPNPYGALEAQKSQAIAARTYALSNPGKRSADGYDLLPTTSDQVYGGFEAEHPISNDAVDGTRGIVATYEGKLITAVFHSTSGGFTANNEDVWNSEATPYLRATQVGQKGNTLKYVPALDVYKFDEEEQTESLRDVKTGDFEAGKSKYYRWNFEWTAEEISDILSTYYNQEVGKVLEINVTERSSSGRAAKIEFVTENGTFYEYKDRIRWALQYINASGNPAVLLSTLFIIEPVKDEVTGEVTGFKTNGGGWGHGVGMSQVGAVGMAEAGFTYDVILKHFYKGIDLETKY